MGKVQAVLQSVRRASFINWGPVVMPKIHNIDQRIQVASSNPATMNTELSEAISGRNANTQHFAMHLKVAVHVVALVTLSYMIALDTDAFIKHPTGTGVEDEMYPMEKVDFPGVAICNMNLISRAAMKRLAEKMWAQEEVRAIGNLTREKIQSLMKYLGHLILFEDEESVPGDIMLCNEILKIALKTNSIMREMEELAPKCGSFMEDCYWRGYYRQCHEIFIQRWTQDGYCCTFNYVRWTDSISSKQDTQFKIKVEHSKTSGQSFGLMVHLKSHTEDKFYNILPGNGFKVLIYKAADYPDAPSGGLREVLLMPGSDNFLYLKPTSFYSSPDVIRYDKSKRNCLFNTEISEIYNGFYSYSQCMMLCRVRDIYKICGCVPFFYPIPPDIGNVTKCTVFDLTCLKQNRYKWWSVKPENSASEENSYNNELKDYSNGNLECDCLPTCENVYFSVLKTGSRIRHFNPEHVSSEVRRIELDDVFLSVSFQTASAVRLRQDALFEWYDLLSNYGGLCSLFLGMSVITPIEILFLICTRLWSRWRNHHSVRVQRSPAVLVEMELPERPIYWKEIIPPVPNH